MAAPSADQASAAASKSTVDINANPVYAQVGKPITQVNIDEGETTSHEPVTWDKANTEEIYQTMRKHGAGPGQT